MRNFVQPGDVITLTAPAALASGAPFAVGAIFAVATGDAESGAPVEAARKGVFDLPKATGQAWTAGARLYWAAGAGNITTTATANLYVGMAARAESSGATVGRVLLPGHAPPVPA